LKSLQARATLKGVDIVKRNRSYYRHHRERMIVKKVYIFTVIMGNELVGFKNGEYYPFITGKYSKGKVHCSCKMCKYHKHYKIEQNKYKHKKALMKKEIDEYRNDWHL